MAAVSTSDVQYLSKVLYPRGYSPKDLYKNKPLLNDLKKDKGFTSARGIEVPVDYALGNGIGGTMAGAVANASAVKGATYTVPQIHQYGYAFLSGEVWRNATKSKDDGRFLDYAKKQFDDGRETFMQEVARQAYGRSTGARAQISTTTAPTGSTIVLKNPSDSVFFRVGMIIQASATDGAALAAGTPGYATITKITPSTGTITVDGTVTTQITGITTSWFLYMKTIASDNGTGNGGMNGLGDWNPVTASTSFLGVNQTLNPAILAGVVSTETSNLETLFIRARAKALTEVGTGYSMGQIYLHPLQFAQLVSTKEGAKLIEDTKLFEMGITKMRLGQFTFVEDAFCPIDYAHIVAEDAFEFHTCGDQPEIGQAFEDPDVDQIKVKMNLDGNFLSHKPSNLMRQSLPAV